MLPSHLRLKLPPKWNRNFPDKTVNTKLFKLVIKKVGSQTVKVGFIINNKVGKATVRNRLRRQIEQVCGPQIDNSQAGLEMIFIAYPSAASAEYEEIRSQVDFALSKVPLR